MNQMIEFSNDLKRYKILIYYLYDQFIIYLYDI